MFVRQKNKRFFCLQLFDFKWEKQKQHLKHHSVFRYCKASTPMCDVMLNAYMSNYLLMLAFVNTNIFLYLMWKKIYGLHETEEESKRVQEDGNVLWLVDWKEWRSATATFKNHLSLTVLQKRYVIIAIGGHWVRHLFGDFFVTALKHDCSVCLAGNIYTCLSSVCAFIFACHNVRLFCVKTGRTHRWIADRGVMLIRFASCYFW